MAKTIWMDNHSYINQQYYKKGEVTMDKLSFLLEDNVLLELLPEKAFGLNLNLQEK